MEDSSCWKHPHSNYPTVSSLYLTHPPIGYPSLGHAPFLCRTAGLRPMDWCVCKAPFRLGPGLCGDCLATGHPLPTPASALAFHRGVPSECSHRLPTDKPLHCSRLQGDTACDICQAGDGERATLIKVGLCQCVHARSGEHILVLCGETSDFPLSRNPVLVAQTHRLSQHVHVRSVA